jgi:hypothetical protein
MIYGADHLDVAQFIAPPLGAEFRATVHNGFAW